MLIKRNSEDRLTMYSVAMIIGGGLGNLIDRVFMGYVVDYLDFRVFPVFNLADSAIVIGAFVLIIGMMVNDSKISGQQTTENREEK